jgi:rubrerythrin
MKGETMTFTTVTKATGGKTMPIGMTVTAPECGMTGSDLMRFGGEAEINGIFMANLLSAFTAHERCGVHLYRTVAGLTQIPECREKYEEFGLHTEDHIRILEELTAKLGGDPMYVSPQARMCEFVNTKLMEPILLNGSVDSLTQELTCLEAVLIAEMKCQANWLLMGKLANEMSDSPGKNAIGQAVEDVQSEEDEHVKWARNTWETILMAQLMSNK